MNAQLSVLSNSTFSETFSFKDERLNEVSSTIAAIYNNAAAYAQEKNRELARLFSRVKNEKLYELDGFDSVQTYANKTFGINRSNAYALAAAGDIYNDENASEILKQLSASNLASIASVSVEKLNEAVERGDITAETSQRELKALSKSLKEEQKEEQKEPQQAEVLPLYVANVIGGKCYYPDGTFSYYNCNPNGECDVVKKNIPEFDKWFCDIMKLDIPEADEDLEVEIINLPKAGKTIRKLYLTPYGSRVVEYEALKNVKLRKENPVPVIEDEIIGLLASKTDFEIAEYCRKRASRLKVSFSRYSYEMFLAISEYRKRKDASYADMVQMAEATEGAEGATEATEGAEGATEATEGAEGATEATEDAGEVKAEIFEALPDGTLIDGACIDMLIQIDRETLESYCRRKADMCECEYDDFYIPLSKHWNAIHANDNN